MANIKDVAKYCGVSTMTVSRVVNNHINVSDETRKKVSEACETLGYIQNHAAKSLITKETNVIGFLVPDIGNYYAEIIKQVTSYLEQKGYGVILCDYDQDKEKENKYLHYLLGGRVDGIINFPIDPQKEDYTHVIKHLPMVIVNKRVDFQDISFVATDNYLGGIKMVEYMISKGYKNIGVVCGWQNKETMTDRLRAYKDVLHKYKIPYNPDIILERDLTFEEGYKGAAALIEKKVEAIFAMNDIAAMGMLKYCNDHHLSVPRDIGIGGYDNIKQVQMWYDDLTTIDYNGPLVGVTAAGILLDEIKNSKLPKRNITLEPRLIIRGSL